MLIFATDRETCRERWLPSLATGRWALATVADWPSLLVRLVQPRVGMLVVDPELPGLRPALLIDLAASLPHRPLLRAVDQPLPGIPVIPSRPAALHALLVRRLARGARDELHGRLIHSGLGAAAERLVSLAAAAEGPVIVLGARGTGKEQHARLIHDLAGGPGPFVILEPGETVRSEPKAGTAYFESAHLVPDLAERVREAERAGWRVIAAARTSIEIPGALVLSLAPLRERPGSIVPLTHHFLDLHARRLGTPRRRFDRRLLSLLQAWSWPLNERELDRFVHDVLGEVDGPLVRAASLPPTLRARLDPAAPAPGTDLEGFEETVAARLAAVVSNWHADSGTALNALVVDATERALYRLVLARTQGNRKAAAGILGVARNTLHARLARLGVSVALPE
ncbi:MAG: hypothetical protein EXR71_01775 [Myxococcales bacterium]|nr:hypothetical protein [Myxococcales bacterium]